MKIIRLTESDLHRLVKESVRRVLAETDASAAGGGALGGCNIMNGTSDESGGIAYPFGGVQRRGGYNSQRSKKNSGDVTKQESNVDMSPAMKRDKVHGISMNRQK